MRKFISILALLFLFPSFGYAYDSQQLPGNEVTPLVGGNAIFNQVHTMIQEAKKSIHVEMYSLEQISIANELIASHKAGLEVQILLDESSNQTGSYLSKNGVDVRYYPRYTSKIDHVKLLSIDGNVSLIGGMNWGNHSPKNHDADILIKGPAANDINTIFVQDWKHAGGQSSYTTSTPLHTTGTNTISNITTSRNSTDIKNHVLHLIKHTKNHLYIEIYILTDPDVIQSLINARRRGIDVQILLDPQQPANKGAYEQLKHAGVKVLYYPTKQDQRFHIKLAISDHKRTLIGSCNWSKSGFHKNHELNSDVLGVDTASFFEEMFLKDWALAEKAG